MFIYGRLLILIPEYSPFRPSAGISFSDTELPVYLCTGTAQRLCCEFVRNSVKKVRRHRTFLTHENPYHPRGFNELKILARRCSGSSQDNKEFTEKIRPFPKTKTPAGCHSPAALPPRSEPSPRTNDALEIMTFTNDPSPLRVISLGRSSPPKFPYDTNSACQAPDLSDLR